MKKFFSHIALSFLIVLNLVSTQADASCCSSASSAGIPRLLAHERALVELSSSFRYVLGRFNERALFSTEKRPHLPHMVLENDVQIMTRLFDFFEPFARIPVRIQKSEVRTGARLADISVGARIPVFKENLLPLLPALTFLTSVNLPTGTKQAEHNEDITSTGAYVIAVGLMLEKEFHKIGYGLGYTFSAETDFFTNKTAKPGAIHAPLFTLGFTVHDNGYLSFSLAPVFHAVETAKSKAIADSDRRKITIGVGYAFTLHSHIKINAALGCDVPIATLGKNFNNDIFLRLGMRFGVF